MNDLARDLTRDLLRGLDPVATFEEAFQTEALAWQRDYLRRVDNVQVKKGRQVGASTASAALGIHVCLYEAPATVVIVSPSERQSREILLRAKAAIRNLSRDLIEDSASALGLGNGSRLLSLPGTPTSVRGYTARLLILDEAAYLDSDTIVASSALVATGGRTLVLSTPAGAARWFYETWEADLPGWSKINVPTPSVPTVSADFLARQRHELGPVAYAQEYLGEFTAGGSSLFAEEKLRSLVRADVAAWAPEGF